MAIDFKLAKKLCSTAELKLLALTKPVPMAALSAAELRRKSILARRHADKWRELVIKQSGGDAEQAQHSQDKHRMFAEALGRFNGKLDKVLKAERVKEKPVAEKALGNVKKAPTKSVAASRKQVAPTKAMKKKVAARKAASPAQKPAAKKAVVKTPPQNAAALTRENKGIAKGLVTGQNSDQSGLNSRAKEPVSATGKRNQAARSSRKRS